MVVILPEAQYAEWLDAPAKRSREFMAQYPAERLVATPEPVPPNAVTSRTRIDSPDAPD